MTQDSVSEQVSPADKPRRPRNEPPVITLSATEIISEPIRPSETDPTPAKVASAQAMPDEQASEPMATSAETGNPPDDTPSNPQKPPKSVGTNGILFVLSALLGGGIGAAATLAAVWYLNPQDGVTAHLAQIEQSIDQKASASALSGLDKRVALLETAAREFSPLTKQQPVQESESNATARIAVLEQSIEALSNRPLTPSDAVGRAAARISLTVLVQDKIAAGQPFKREWQALSGLLTPGAERDTLETLAKTGVKSANALRAEALAQLTKKPATPTDPSPTTLGDRVLKSLSGLVKITPIDAPDAAAPQSVTTGIDRALATDDCETALALWKLLPDERRQTLSAWAEAVSARMSARRAVDALLSNALEALASTEAKP